MSRIQVITLTTRVLTTHSTTGMAVTIDLGDPKAPAGDVHSRVKDPVAYRLALQAMHCAYAFQEGENVTNWGSFKRNLFA